jgi:hypothetical protein
MISAFSSCLTTKVIANAVDNGGNFACRAATYSVAFPPRDYRWIQRYAPVVERRCRAKLTVAVSRAKEKLVLVSSRSIFSLFSPDEAAFANAQLWKSLLRRTCATLLWEGDLSSHNVQVWGNAHD